MTALARSLAGLVGDEAVLDPPPAMYAADATETQGLAGAADAVVQPASAEQVRAVVEWCCRQGVPMVPRGGGTGISGGAVPVSGGVVIDLSRMCRVRQFDPLLWRIHVEAGMTTAELRRLVRESGVYFPPDPGAAEQSQIGGNIATNAGGPHAFKYGVTGAWVTGLEAVVAPGELVAVGGAVRKDVAGYDLKSLLVGSEGTLGVITAAWLRLVPAPELTLPVAGAYRDAGAGCEAIETVLGSGVQAAAIEYLDAGTLAAAGRAFPGGLPAGTGFLVIGEADGSREEARRVAAELQQALAGGALQVQTVDRPEDLWRWRGGVSGTVAGTLGGRLSEDIAVPVDRLREAIEGTVEIGRRHGVEAVSWGHAGDGNVHSNFLFARDDGQAFAAATAAAEELFEMAARLGGSISAEHGTGWVKRGRLHLQWAPAAVELHRRIKQAFDPAGLMNPGKKT